MDHYEISLEFDNSNRALLLLDPYRIVFFWSKTKIIPVELLCSNFFNGEFIFGEGLTGELTFWYV